MARNCLSASWRFGLGAAIPSGSGQTRRACSSLAHHAASPQFLLPCEASSNFCALIPRNCMPWGESRGLAEAQVSLLPWKDPNSLSLIALLFG